MLRALFFAFVFILTGLIIGLNVNSTPDPQFTDFEAIELATQTETNTLNKQNLRLNELEKILKQETLAREVLSQKITDLQSQVQQLQLLSNQQNNSNEVQLTEKTPDVPQVLNNAPSQPEPRTSKDVLLAMGLDESIAEQLKKREEAKEMDFLYLRNKATREGWFGTEKFFEESQKLENDSNIYRQELGDETYDKYLYQSDQSNRVEVRSVLSDSPAAVAGIEAGDIVYSYDDQRIFKWNELTSLTATGEAGQSVNIEVHRDEQIFNLSIPRGPMGVRLSGKKIDPDNS